MKASLKTSFCRDEVIKKTVFKRRQPAISRKQALLYIGANENELYKKALGYFTPVQMKVS